jgi:hypothetical protein
VRLTQARSVRYFQARLTQHILECDLPLLAEYRGSIFHRDGWVEEQMEYVEERHAEINGAVLKDLMVCSCRL